MTVAIAIALALSIAAMAAIIAARYLLVSAGFAWLVHRVRPALYRARNTQIRREIAFSLASAAIYAVPAGIVAWGWTTKGWTKIYPNLVDYPRWWAPLSVLVYLLIHDSWFYWTHRAMHHPRLFARMHAVHHKSRPPTAFAAMSFHPYEAITGAVVIPALVMLIPIHIASLGMVLAIMTVMGTINHLGHEILPRRLVRSRIGAWIISASHHHRHHEEYQCNFGLYFRVWDRLCGTDRPPRELTG